jgi:ABC-type glutathione transport system ATPase component
VDGEQDLGAESAPVVGVCDLVKRYGKSKVNAVDGVSFSVRRGEVFGLLGPNGAGKTTTVGILTTRVRRTAATTATGGATVPLGHGALTRPAIGSWILQVATAAALGIDAVVHWQNASAYDAVTGTVSQGELFRAEAALAAVVGLGVLVRPWPSSWLAARLVAASALGAVLW